MKEIKNMSHSKEDIEKILSNEIATILSKDIALISNDESLHAMGFDSLSFVELLVSIEKTFGLKLIDSNLSKEDFQSIETLAKRICEALK